MIFGQIQRKMLIYLMANKSKNKHFHKIDLKIGLGKFSELHHPIAMSFAHIHYDMVLGDIEWINV